MSQKLTFTKTGEEYNAEAGEVLYNIARTAAPKLADEDDEIVAGENDAPEWQPAFAWRDGNLWARAPHSFRTLDEAKFWCEQEHEEHCMRTAQKP